MGGEAIRRRELDDHLRAARVRLEPGAPALTLAGKPQREGRLLGGSSGGGITVSPLVTPMCRDDLAQSRCA